MQIFVQKNATIFFRVHIFFPSKYDSETEEDANQSLLSILYFSSVEICVYVNSFPFLQSKKSHRPLMLQA